MNRKGVRGNKKGIWQVAVKERKKKEKKNRHLPKIEKGNGFIKRRRNTWLIYLYQGWKLKRTKLKTEHSASVVVLLCAPYGHVFNLFWFGNPLYFCVWVFDMDGIGCAVVDATICFSLSCLCVSLQHRGSPNLVPIVIAKVPFYQSDIDSCIGHAKHFAAFISNWVRHVQKSESYLLPLPHITLHNSYSCTQQISPHAPPHHLLNPTATLFHHVHNYPLLLFSPNPHHVLKCVADCTPGIITI